MQKKEISDDKFNRMISGSTYIFDDSWNKSIGARSYRHDQLYSQVNS